MKVKKASLIIFIILIICVLTLCLYKKSNTLKKWIYTGDNSLKLSNSEINNEEESNDESKETRDLKVLVLEFDPILKTKGNIKCSEYLEKKGETKNIIYEVLDDIEYSSNGYIKVDPSYKETWIDTNEFPRYTCEIDVITGYDENGNEIISKSRQMNEETWLTIMQEGWYKGMIHPKEGEPGYKDWYRYVDQIPEYSFDYEYVIEKYNLIERRNNGEFDWVFISAIEPSKGNEANMVGTNAYNINGRPIDKYECKAFPIITANPLRKDGVFHNIGHATEWIMNNVFQSDTFSIPYRENDVSITSEEDYNKLTLWDKFALNKAAVTLDSMQKFGVGNVHYPSNARNKEDEYGYWNKEYTYSNWKDWRYNYPNLKGEWEITNSSAWEDEIPPFGEMDNGRRYMRWWFKNMPHVEGRNEEGYYHNWWKYISTLDYVDQIYSDESKIVIYNDSNDKVLKCRCFYKSGEEEIIEDNKQWTIVDTSIAEINSEGTIIGKKAGITNAIFWRDGRNCSIEIEVREKNDFTDCVIKLENSEFTYNGEEIKPKITEIIGRFEGTIKEGEDYIVSYQNNKDAGEAEVMVTGIGKCVGETKTKFTIKPKQLLVFANSIQIEYGEEIPPLDYEIMGEIKNEKAGIDGSLKIVKDNNDDFVIGKQYVISCEDLKLVDNGDFKAKNYYMNCDKGVFLVLKAKPKYEIPKNIEVESGTMLKDVVLPDGFTWEDDINTIIDGAGTKIFKCTYTPKDTEHYKIINGIDVEIYVYHKLNIETEKYTLIEDDKKYIKCIDAKTTLYELKNNITTNGNITVIKDTMEILEEDAKIGTGMRIIISLDQKEYEYIAVVKGDANGDGEADMKDILQINKHRLNHIVLNDEFYYAGDVNEDNILNITDIFIINKFKLGIINKL